jgi:uridine kinase
MIRDYRTRGHSAERTLDLWPSVIKGAREYIFPYQSSAVAMFNSSLPYELAVLRGYAQPLLQTVPESSSMHGEARRLLSMLKFVPPLPSENVPSNSILREFIGGGCYEH